MEIVSLPIREVFQSPTPVRKAQDSAVNTLAESMDQVGLRTPITVRPVEKYVDAHKRSVFEIVSGNHRFLAAKKLGWDEIPCIVMADGDDERARRMWEIAENLHRAELTALERDKLVGEWVFWAKEGFSAQPAQKLERGRPHGGESEAARQLAMDRDDVRRAVKVASLSEEAQAAARRAGLDDNRTALLAAARKAEPAEQVMVLESWSVPKRESDVIEAQVKALMNAWNRATEEARERFLSLVGQ